MSVYTTVSKKLLIEFLNHYDVGELSSYEGISEGIENTNYFVNTSKSQFVLTIFEWLNPKKIPYFLNLMVHLSENGILCPRPIADSDGNYLRELCNKPATLITRLNGHTLKDVNPTHTEQVGRLLATMHQINSLTTQLENIPNDIHGNQWWNTQSKQLKDMMDSDDYSLLLSEIEYQKNIDINNLPTGIIHSDLFRDNALFDNNQLSGVIDFYYSYHGILLYDVAVTVNDWCRNDDASIDHIRYKTLMDAYNAKRAFINEEREMWQRILRRAALRFWISRLSDYYFPREGEITHAKNPIVFRDILLNCQQHPLPI